MLVSVIIPMRNEKAFVRGCLESFVRQLKDRKDIEILCIDGMSTDGTAEIVAEYASADKRIHLVNNPAQITPVAMNLGIKHAIGKFIMVVNCHTEYASDYIDKCLSVINRTGADLVGGYVTTIPINNTPTGRAIVAATSCSFGIGNSKFRLSGVEQQVDTVPSGMYRKEVHDKIGFYDERLVRNQDIELNHRLRRAGGRIIISPEIKFSYHNRSTYRGLWQQSFNNGLWNPYTVWLTGGGLSLRHFVPMFFVLGLVIITAGSFLWWPVKWILAGYILLYLTAAFSFSIRSARQNKTSVFLVLWSFVVLHIAYGFGSLWSIVTIPFKFANRNKKIINKPLADRKT